MFTQEHNGRVIDMGDIDTREPGHDQCPKCAEGRLNVDSRIKEFEGWVTYFSCDTCDYQDSNLTGR